VRVFSCGGPIKGHSKVGLRKGPMVMKRTKGPSGSVGNGLKEEGQAAGGRGFYRSESSGGACARALPDRRSLTRGADTTQIIFIIYLSKKK